MPPPWVGTAAWPAPVIAVAHSDVGTWWHAMRSGPPPDDLAWRIEATRAGLHAATRVIAPTRSHADAIRTVYGDTPITVVHNGAPPMTPQPIPRTRAGPHRRPPLGRGQKAPPTWTRPPP